MPCCRGLTQSTQQVDGEQVRSSPLLVSFIFELLSQFGLVNFISQMLQFRIRTLESCKLLQTVFPVGTGSFPSGHAVILQNRATCTFPESPPKRQMLIAQHQPTPFASNSENKSLARKFDRQKIAPLIPLLPRLSLVLGRACRPHNKSQWQPCHQVSSDQTRELLFDWDSSLDTPQNVFSHLIKKVLKMLSRARERECH